MSNDSSPPGAMIPKFAIDQQASSDVEMNSPIFALVDSLSIDANTPATPASTSSNDVDIEISPSDDGNMIAYQTHL